MKNTNDEFKTLAFTAICSMADSIQNLISLANDNNQDRYGDCPFCNGEEDHSVGDCSSQGILYYAKAFKKWVEEQHRLQSEEDGFRVVEINDNETRSTPKICRFCEHWREIRVEDYYVEELDVMWPGPHGECRKIHEYSQDNNAWTHASTEENCDSDTGLITTFGFGCNQWEEGEEL